jgi:Ca-activated chloride channel family protein
MLPMMKLILFASVLAVSLALNSSFGETLRLKVEPDHDCLLTGASREVVVKIDLLAVDLKKRSRRVPLNIAVVLDRSGSMSGSKIEKARQGAMELVDHLAPGDFFSFITYSDRADVVFAAQQVEDKEAIKRMIERVHAGGSTALYAGVKLGAEEVKKHLNSKRINRVILVSDGLANIGPSSTRDLRGLGNSLSEDGVSVTTIGVGDDYNEDLMAGLAEASDANYYYVKDTERLPQIFAKELGELTTLAARDIRIEIICPDGVKPTGFLGRPETFEGQKGSVRLSNLTAGQDRYVFMRCIVPEGTSEVARVNVSYVDELNSGTTGSLNGKAEVRFVNDDANARKSLRADVVAQKELLVTAVAKDEALASADAGKFQEAAQKLAASADSLAAKCKDASPEFQSQARQEIENLQRRSKELQQGQYNTSTRKSLQNESWTYRNSKNSQQ